MKAKLAGIKEKIELSPKTQKARELAGQAGHSVCETAGFLAWSLSKAFKHVSGPLRRAYDLYKKEVS